jgi:hypothetical protein
MTEEFVTKAECYKTHAQILTDFGTFKKALVGDDLRGGIVKDVADTKKDIAEIKTALKNNGGNGSNNGRLGKKEKAIVYSALITSVGGTTGIIIIEALKFFH